MSNCLVSCRLVLLFVVVDEQLFMSNHFIDLGCNYLVRCKIAQFIVSCFDIKLDFI